jgi:hypothetical protein
MLGRTLVVYVIGHYCETENNNLLKSIEGEQRCTGRLVHYVNCKEQGQVGRNLFFAFFKIRTTQSLSHSILPGVHTSSLY